MSRINLYFLVLTFAFFSCQEDQQHTPSNLNIVQGVINDNFLGEPVAVYADGLNNTLIAFSRNHSQHDETLTLSISDDITPAVLQDQFGNNYDINGKALDQGSSESYNLKKVNFLVGYWFFFPAFFNNVDLYNGQTFSQSINPPSDGWLVDKNYIFTGSSRDGIPSIDHPEFISVDGKALVDDPFYGSLGENELVSVVTIGTETHVYPHKILEYHEIVNDQISGVNIALSFCPLTGTSRAWKSEVKNQFTEFGVSGLLYNNNLILYDRVTESYWSQILELSINGNCLAETISPVQVYETTFKRAKRLANDVSVLSTNTGFNYIYEQSIYDDYRGTERVSFPLSVENQSLSSKERVLGVIKGDKVKIYTFDDFNNL